VTAEPYFAVSQPSNVVILENAIKPDNKEKIELIDAQYELLPRGQYTKNMAATDLQPLVMDKKTPFSVYQARNAVRIAKAAGAESYAADSLKNAEGLLALAETKEGGKKGRAMTAREAVQSAEDSRSLAVKRQADEAIIMRRSKRRSRSAAPKVKLPPPPRVRQPRKRLKPRPKRQKNSRTPNAPPPSLWLAAPSPPLLKPKRKRKRPGPRPKNPKRRLI